MSGSIEIVILDFDKAVVLGDSARDSLLLRNEAQDMEEALDIALSKKDMLGSLPKEVKKATSMNFRALWDIERTDQNEAAGEDSPGSVNGSRIASV